MISVAALSVTFVLIAQSEFGGKTQFAIMALACGTKQIVRTAVGSAFGDFLAVMLGVVVGTILDFRIPGQLPGPRWSDYFHDRCSCSFVAENGKKGWNRPSLW
jgi:hypothetical protein